MKVLKKKKKEPDHADTLILDFRPLELWKMSV